MALQDRHSPAAAIYYTFFSQSNAVAVMSVCVCVIVCVCVYVCYMLLYSQMSRPGLLLPFLLIRTSAGGRRDGEKGRESRT